jgi:hypothetical protein
LLGLNEHALKVHPEVLKKDIEFKDKSKDAEKIFGKLNQDELKKMHENFVVVCGGKISKNIKKPARLHESSGAGGENIKGAPSTARPNAFAEIREKHPNAYKPWSREQDEELKKLFTAGQKIKDLMKSFGRKRGGITARLEKLGLVEK